MKSPLDLLKERLKEIEAVECDEKEFKHYRNQYLSTIRFLENNGVGKRFRKKLTPVEEFYVKKHFGTKKVDELVSMFNISYETLRRIACSDSDHIKKVS